MIYLNYSSTFFIYLQKKYLNSYDFFLISTYSAHLYFAL